MYFVLKNQQIHFLKKKKKIVVTRFKEKRGKDNQQDNQHSHKTSTWVQKPKVLSQAAFGKNLEVLKLLVRGDKFWLWR